MPDSENLRFRDQQIRQRIVPLINAARHSLLYFNEPDLRYVTERGVAAELRTSIKSLGSAARAFFRLYSVYDATIVTLKMSRRSPWNDHEISESRHLELVWFQFVSQCALFREQAKRFGNRYNRVMIDFGRATINVASTLKTIDESLEKHIRARGWSMNEWYVERSDIGQFDAMEIVNAVERADSPLGTVEGHYDAAKNFLGTEIEDTIAFMEEFLIATLDNQVAPLMETIAILDSRMNGLKAGAQVGDRTPE
jgi:hypothetical protein